MWSSNYPSFSRPIAPVSTVYRDALAEINAAITAVATKGQRYKIGDRELWRGDLEWLFAERRRLEPVAAREVSGGIRVRRAVPL